MWKMSAFQLGVLLFAICLTTQVMSQNLTVGNTMVGNTTVSSNVSTTMSPGSYSTSTNSTGAGLQAGAGAVLAPLLVALHRLC